LPISATDKIKSGEDNSHSQQHTAEKPKRRGFGENALAHCPPETAEKYRAEQKANDQGERQK
jgi:hypothetical protein